MNVSVAGIKTECGNAEMRYLSSPSTAGASPKSEGPSRRKGPGGTGLQAQTQSGEVESIRNRFLPGRCTIRPDLLVWPPMKNGPSRGHFCIGRLDGWHVVLRRITT